MKIEIPGECQECPFFSETEDGECWCSIYQKQWEYDEDGSDTGVKFNEGDKPLFCKAKYVEVVE